MGAGGTVCSFHGRCPGRNRWRWFGRCEHGQGKASVSFILREVCDLWSASMPTTSLSLASATRDVEVAPLYPVRAQRPRQSREQAGDDLRMTLSQSSHWQGDAWWCCWKQPLIELAFLGSETSVNAQKSGHNMRRYRISTWYVLWKSWAWLGIILIPRRGILGIEINQFWHSVP